MGDTSRTTNRLVFQTSLTSTSSKILSTKSTLLSSTTTTAKTTLNLTNKFLQANDELRKKKAVVGDVDDSESEVKKAKILTASHVSSGKSHVLLNSSRLLNTKTTASTTSSLLAKPMVLSRQVKENVNVIADTYNNESASGSVQVVIQASELFTNIIETNEYADLMRHIQAQNEQFELETRTIDEKAVNFIDPFSVEQKLSKLDPTLVNAKNTLINMVSSSLLRAPNFKDAKDATRLSIIQVASAIVPHDPEFLLKLALYTRKELNIRVTANFLLSLCSFYENCRCYLSRYFTSSVVLPSDWIDVAEQYQLFFDKRIKFGALPAALRKCMQQKFTAFDEYQLAKYNKDKSKSAKKKNDTLGDVKHFRVKLDDGDIMEDKYIKTLEASGLKVNDSVHIELLLKDGFKSFKIDFVAKKVEDTATAAPVKFSRRNQPVARAKSDEKPDESVALRFMYDRAKRIVTKKVYTRKVWSRGEVVDDATLTDESLTMITMRVDVQADEFKVFVNDRLITTHPHRLHNIELAKLNVVRISGIDIKLKDLRVDTKELVHGLSSATDETDEENEQRTYTLKQLIRQLHIAQPVQHVLCLLGKKYPASYDEFMKSGLPGTYDSDKAGKRMKLPVPETWETQVSMKGNHAHVWQQLIDNKKLPYMAMLRNLRNMVKAGIDEKHHQWVIKKLQDEGAVVNSKQFPISFFSAYEVLDELEKEFDQFMSWCETGVEPVVEQAPARRGGRGGARGGGGRVKVKSAAERYKDMNYDKEILKRYKKALDNALKVATTYNVSPIKGKSLILVSLGDDASVECKTARIGKGKRSICDIAVLLGLMFKYSCEFSKLVFYTNVNGSTHEMELEEGTILDNMKSILDLRNKDFGERRSGLGIGQSVVKSLNELVSARVQYDNVVVLSADIMNDADSMELLNQFLKKYRVCVNDNLLFVNVSLGAMNVGLSMNQTCFKHTNDVTISGYSDSILRFVAERGNQGQLLHIENIDKSYELPELTKCQTTTKQTNEVEMQVEKPLAIFAPCARWRTTKVFISSTFRDMHSERDILSRIVFPMLREKLNKRFVNVQEVDMRWGITDSQVAGNRTLDICLSQINEADFFVGLLGSRYGHVVDSYEVSEKSHLSWLKTHPPGASITELEIEFGAFRKLPLATALERCFFYFRNDTFLADVPPELRAHFEAESDEAREKLRRLKQRLHATSFEIYDGYPCKWFDVDSSGRALVTNLNLFAERVFNSLLNAITHTYPYEETGVQKMDEQLNETGWHGDFWRMSCERFVGRHKLLTQCEKLLNEKMKAYNYKANIPHVMLIDGDAGCGKTAFVSRLLQVINEKTAHVFMHFVGACLNSEYIIKFLKRFVTEINRNYNLDIDEAVINESSDLKYHKSLLERVLDKLMGLIQDKLFVVIDGADSLLDNNGNLDESLNWLPDVIPGCVTFILTARSQSRILEAISKRQSSMRKDNADTCFTIDRIQVAELELLDKCSFVRETLAVHHKQLNETGFNNQMKLVTGKRDGINPLYLVVACEELRLHNNYDTLTQKLKDIPQRLTQLIPYVLERLEADFGVQYVQQAFVFLTCARDHLHEYELKSLLSLYLTLQDENALSQLDKMASVKDLVQCHAVQTQNAQNTQIKFLSFLESIKKTFLNSTSTEAASATLCLRSNVIIENAIRGRYTKASATIEQAHRVMALYYWLEIDAGLESKWSTSKNPRSFTYLPYHLYQGALYGDLVAVLSDLKFLSLKCSLGLTVQLLDDYNHRPTSKTTKTGGKVFEAKSYLDYKTFIMANYHILMTCPSLIFQQALNQPKDTAPWRDLQDIVMLKEVRMMFEQLNTLATNTDVAVPMRINDFQSAVSAVAVSTNGAYVACGTDDCEIEVYALHTAKLVKKLNGHSGRIHDLCFVGADTLCSTSSDGLASLWNFSAGYRIRVLNKHNDHVVSGCAAEPNGKVFVTVGWDCSIRVWNIADGNYMGELKSHGRPINCVAFHPTGTFLATGCWDSCLRIFDVFNRQRKAVLRGHLSSVRSIAYSANGVYLASASIDGEVFLWNAVNGTQVGIIKGHSLPVNSLRYSDNGNLLVTCSSDRRVKVWSGRSGKMIQVIRDEAAGTRITAVCVNQKDGKKFAVGCQFGDISVYDMDGTFLTRYNVHNASITHLKYTHDGKMLISAAENGTVFVTDVSDGQVKVSACLVGSATRINALAVNRYGLIVTGSEDSLLRTYTSDYEDEDDLYDDRPARRRDNTFEPSCVYNKHVSAVTGCSFNADGTRLVTTSKDAAIVIWRLNSAFDVQMRVERQIEAAHFDWITDCEWSNTGDFILTASNDFCLKIWDANTGTERGRLNGHTASISKCLFQYGCVVSSCADGTLKVWSHKGYEITTLTGHQGRVNSCDMYITLKTNVTTAAVATQPNEEEEARMDWADQVDEEDREKWRQSHESKKLNKKTHTLDQMYVVSVSDDHTIRIWKPMETDSLLDLTGHSNRVNSLTIGKNGVLCTGSTDRSVLTWNLDKFITSVTSGKLIEKNQNTQSHRAEVTCVCKTKLSDLILTASTDGVLMVWHKTGFDGFEMVKELQAHDKTLNRIVMLSGETTTDTFVTCSDDGFIKVWSLETVHTPSFHVNIKLKKLLPEVQPVKFIDLIDNTALLFVTMMSSMHIAVGFYDTQNNYVKMGKVGCRLIGYGSFVNDFKVYDRHLYITDTNQNVICVDLLPRLSVHKHFNAQQGEDQNGLVVFKGTVEPDKSNWFNVIVRSEHGDLFAGDWSGHVHTSRSSDVTKQFYIHKKLHTQCITQIIEVNVYGSRRFITASHDGTVKIWTENFDRQIGQFNFSFAITALSVVQNIGNQVHLVCGSQMGNVEVLRWFDKQL